MLTHNFNDAAEHQKEQDFHYSMKGDSENVGRIQVNSFQEHKSEHFIKKKDKEFSDLITRIKLLGDIMDGIKGAAKRAGDWLNKMEEEKRLLENLVEKIQAGDEEDLRKHIEETYGVDTSEMSPEEVEAWAIQRAYEHLDSYEAYEAEYLKEMRNIAKKIEELKKNGATEEQIREAEKIQKQLENRYESIGRVKGYDFLKAAENAESNIKSLRHSSEVKHEIAKRDGDGQTDDGFEYSKSETVTASLDDEFSELASSDPLMESPYPELKGKAVEDFQTVAASDPYAALDAELEASLDEESLDSELAAIESTKNLPGLG